MRSVSSDSRAIRPDALFVAVKGERFDGHAYVESAFAQGAAAALVSRTVRVPWEFLSRPQFRVDDTVEAYGRLARYYRLRWGGKVIGVTGSNGKTTTREMLAHLLSAGYPLTRSPKSFNNEIGVPSTIFGIEPEHELAIVEMGTSAPGEIAYLAGIARPDYGVITNIGETHLEGLGSIEGVALAKGELLDALGRDGVAFLNADDPWRQALADRHEGRTVLFGRSEKADVRCVHEERFDGGTRFRLADGAEFELNVPGEHNVSNALAALAVCGEFGALDTAAERLRTFVAPDMRFQVTHIQGATLISDCYNANLRSMVAAVEEMDAMPCRGRRVMVCGDMLEMGAQANRMHWELGRRVGRSRIDEMFTVGDSSRLVSEAARETRRVPSEHFASVEQARAPVAQAIGPEDLVLVKGSRAMRLEAVVDAVRERFQSERALAEARAS